MRLSLRQQAAQTAVGARDGQIAEQRRGARVQRRVSIAAGLLRQRASDEALADAGGSEHEDVFVIRHPGRLLRQRADHALVQSASSAVVDLFDAGALQLGGVQPPRQGLILAPGPLLIDQQPEPFQEAQLARRRILLLRLQARPPCRAAAWPSVFPSSVLVACAFSYSKYSAPRMLSCGGGG